MTLIEVLVASGILLFGMVAVVALFTTGARSHHQAVTETQANLAATSILSEVRGLFARGLVPAETPDKKFNELPEHPDFPGMRYKLKIVDLDKIKGQPEVKRAYPNLGKSYFVELTIVWSDRGNDRKSTFHSVMFLRPPAEM